MADDKTIKQGRRDFILKSGGAIAVIAAGSSGFISSCESYVDKEALVGLDVVIDVNAAEYKRYLTKTGAGLIKAFGRANYGVPVIIVKLPDNTYKCYSSMCTHMNCFGSEKFHSPDPNIRDMSDVRPPIGSTEDARAIVCRCHGSRFDPFNDGIPTKGPAERPLTQYKCSFDSATGILTIHF